ncbi:MAG: polyhydroxyalkanoate synthesis repressor PhaR [Hylemonella sp.]|nr:polyhydroxyalkanoate synthesis repressor PhaR [Hylemonella sp.]
MRQQRTEQESGGLRTIKKYPNRRLYDTSASRYITVTEIKQFVIRQEAFVVLDAKTNKDLTRCILLQILVEEESGSRPMFSNEFLSSAICFYGDEMQSRVGDSLGRNIQALREIRMHTDAPALAASSPVPGVEPALSQAPRQSSFLLGSRAGEEVQAARESA